MAKTDELMHSEPSAAYGMTAVTPSSPTTVKKGLMQKNPVLNSALETVQADRLRSIIKNLCLISDTAEKYISNNLLTPEEIVKPGLKRKRVGADEDIEASNGKKRMKIRYEMCTQCGDEFDVTLNYSKACRYHPGQSANSYCIMAFGPY